MTDAMREAAERTGLTHSDIRGLIKRHGGGFHGPRVEHLSMEEQEFWRFIDELILNERRAALSAKTDRDVVIEECAKLIESGAGMADLIDQDELDQQAEFIRALKSPEQEGPKP